IHLLVTLKHSNIMARNKNIIPHSPSRSLSYNLNTHPPLSTTTKCYDKNYYLTLKNSQSMYIHNIVFLRNDHYFSFSLGCGLFVSVCDPLKVLQSCGKQYYVRYHHKNNLSQIVEFWIAKPFVDTLEERLEKAC
ncbi:hypothetical protein MG1_04152, partial [Candida albicans GC75]